MSIIPMAIDHSLEVLREENQQSTAQHTMNVEKYDHAYQQKQSHMNELATMSNEYQSLLKKVDLKRHEYDLLVDKLNDDQSEYHQIEQQILQLNKRYSHFNEQIQQNHGQLIQLQEKLSKVMHLSSVIHSR
jgi:predicted nuclease with TOPRIM domain